MQIKNRYDGRLYTTVSFFESEALSRELLVVGCQVTQRDYEQIDDEFGGVVTIFGADVSVGDLIFSGLQHTRELKNTI